MSCYADEPKGKATMAKPVTEDLFSFQGRRNRQSYVFSWLMWVVAILIVWSVAAVGFISGESYGLLIAAGLITVPIVLSSWATGGQRCRDFGWTGWAMLITLIPYIGWIWGIAIMFIPGTPGPNRYGPDPLGGTPFPAPRY